jgi:ATP-dependent Clp protease ATP-binding subunit ClpA
LNYVDNELANLVAAHSDDAKPTASFQRVLQRATIHIQSSGRGELTGAHVLVAMFAERESHAVNFLQEQDMTRFDASNYISHGIAKAPGRSEARRAQGAEEEDRREQLARRLFPFHSLTRQPPAVDETKLIAAILCARMILPEDTATDPIGTTVDLYERILAELRARGHGSPPK